MMRISLPCKVDLNRGLKEGRRISAGLKTRAKALRWECLWHELMVSSPSVLDPPTWVSFFLVNAGYSSGKGPVFGKAP